jgi:molybdopterin-guanine dinucleotide biosynthesis protein A
MTLEAIVLTGGQSRRMGQDKAKLPIAGVPQAERIVRQFRDADIPATVLGREAVPGARFLRDQSEFGGPIAALSAYEPQADLIFVASCDLPQFDVKLVDFLQQRIGAADACAPEVDGFRQPLCALYTAKAFRKLENLEDQCAMGWLNALTAVIVPEEELEKAGLRPAAARGANTPEELAQALEETTS